ncbi:bifunctional diguanylate cyclase/phosphodiesterase [Devosia sp. ZB163]|uniref:putative bifunctional diguanylate cyclase/phosphodiesterase n=1 Tax=Devosia sp. ZB163 TaxID=3025938 RepID=UPI0023621EFD|nr:bifunctional diguanylate cyclase/phosphodiesterase [Devosia sp. ZB163]MDC9823194.1 bifunctional diguanylate cyclase/phosphodiesterase [Devosia sp. ZB163]
MLNFTLWIALPAFAVYVGVCALVFVAMHLMSSEMNAIDSDRGKKAIAAAVESLVVGLGESAADEATWTEAYINTYVEPNPAWHDSTWGSTARISDTFDTAILTDVDGNIIFGETNRGPVTGTLANAFSGVPSLLRELESGIATVGDDATVAHLSRNDRGAAALAGAVVHGSSGQASIPREHRRILWLAKQLDDAMLRGVAARFELPLPRLVSAPQPGHDWMALTDATGAEIAIIDWPPRRPGDPAFAHTITVAVLVMLVIGALVFVVLALFRRSIQQRAVADERDWYNARYDEITGLRNRFGLVEHISRQITKKRPELPVAVAQIDVDGVLDVTGLYGRETSNQLLTALAARIEALADGTVTLARTAPSEFSIERSGEDAREVVSNLAERIIATAADPVPVGALKLKIRGLSVGFVSATATRDNVSDIVRMAETACARARETGGNHLVVYDPRIEDERRRRIELQADIRRGLDAGEFDLDYQPIIDFRTQGVIGVEALMRWNRRAAGPMGPGEFIPAAEASGLIDDLGMFALRRAIEEIGPLGNLKISVNVSTAQLRNPTLPQTVFTALDEWGVDPARLQLEVTESFLVAHPDRAIKLIEQLRQAGVLIALDDFGTGYSSIGYLKQFSFDRVKLDRSLVADIDSDPVQAALVESTMIYAYAMGLAVTAEGVERREEAALLSRLGCREFQGYLFARPLKLAQLMRLIGEQEPLKAAS